MGKLDDTYRGAKPAAKAADTIGLIASELDDWRLANNADLPPPLPIDSREAAQWWLTKQERERPGETRIVPCGEAATRQDLGYMARCRQSLLALLRLERSQRETVLAGIADGVPYRGDDFEHYLNIWHETERMREIGVKEYARSAVKQMKARIDAVIVPRSHGEARRREI